MQETQEKIAELQEELKRSIAASEAARLQAVATLRKQTTLKEVGSNAVATFILRDYVADPWRSDLVVSC